MRLTLQLVIEGGPGMSARAQSAAARAIADVIDQRVSGHAPVGPKGENRIESSIKGPGRVRGTVIARITDF